MNVLFISLSKYNSIENSDIYTDLLREFIRNGHRVYLISPAERRYGIKTSLIDEGNSQILRVKTGNVQKTNLIEKGISTILIETQIISAIKRYFKGIRFDLVLYSTPPITIGKAIDYIKKRDGAITYLLLKDIFPQNAVDLGMISQNGIKGVLYKYFRKKEKKLYFLSDYIGCMSQANMDYIIKYNSEIDSSIIDISPNCIEINDKSIDLKTKSQIRKKYEIPLDKIVFIYGGNLGKPQDIPFIIKCLQSQKNEIDIYFLIIGDGTEFHKLERFSNQYLQKNFKLLRRLPKEDYETIVRACDVGLIFLDHRFTIPNFPSRILAYMQARIPVLACTDRTSDIGQTIIEGKFGWWCESNNIQHFSEMINRAKEADRVLMGNNGYKYLKEKYDVKKQYESMIRKLTHK